MKKRRQHYVWQHYLHAWVTDGQIACMRDGRVFRTSTLNVAVEKDFYRLRELTAADLALIEEVCFKQCLPELRPLQEGWVSTFTRVFELKRRCDAAFGRDAETERLFDEAINNLEEELHQGIESESIPHLDALRQGDLSFLEVDDDLTGFLHFLCVQYLRTEKMRATTIEAVRGGTGIEIERALGVMNHIFATNIGYALYTSRNKLRITLLRAASGAEFITSDQPVINLHAVGVPPGTPVDNLEMYYPVSPTTALRLTIENPEPGFYQSTIDADEVTRFNVAMFQLAHKQVFATEESVLRSVAAAVNR